MKKAFIAFLLILFTLLIAAAPSIETMARLTIINKTDEDLYIQLTNDEENLHYYLTGRLGTTVFTIEREIYDATFWACGNSTDDVTLDVTRNLRLNFPVCSNVPNAGEPSMEKVHLKDSPSGLKWRFRY